MEGMNVVEKENWDEMDFILDAAARMPIEQLIRLTHQHVNMQNHAWHDLDRIRQITMIYTHELISRAAAAAGMEEN